MSLSDSGRSRPAGTGPRRTGTGSRRTGTGRRRGPWNTRVGRVALAVGLVAALVVSLPALIARVRTEPHQYRVADVPPTDVVLVPGAEVFPGGHPSTYLVPRLDLAAELYHRGKAKVVVVSGASGPEVNHEVEAMADQMAARGVPQEHIVIDPQGWDTYASCWRARHVYGVEKLTVVSQRWHVTRALFQCRQLGIQAYGVGDTSLVAEYPLGWVKYNVRELGALWKAWINLAQDREGPQDPPSDEVTRALAE